MTTTDYYMIMFIILFACFFVADLFSAKVSRGLYVERTQELRRLNNIKIYQFEEKTKPKIVPPPNPWNNIRQPTAKEILDQAEDLSRGKGIAALIRK